jgi:hydroxymethylpyrimidine pyrophosphatase-like HAD family hydrolase
MFNMVDCGVCVNSANPNVIEAADTVTDAHGKEGSLELLRALIDRI